MSASHWIERVLEYNKSLELSPKCGVDPWVRTIEEILAVLIRGGSSTLCYMASRKRMGCAIGGTWLMVRMGGTGNTSKPGTSYFVSLSTTQKRKKDGTQDPSKLSTAAAVRGPQSY